MGTRSLFFLLLLLPALAAAQARELATGWQCRKATDVILPAAELSKPGTALAGFMPAIVPGTVLTSLLHNGKISDPFFGMNNRLIPDVYDAGRELYTYWFVNNFTETAAGNEHVFLRLRGINYACDIYLNGRKVNEGKAEGMYLRHNFDITALLAKDGRNRLAIIVQPPYITGNPNGGQGGDGTIARNVTNQYVAGWDWIQPIADRNTGIWDKVFIDKVRAVDINDVFVTTKLLPGAAAALSVHASLTNHSRNKISGTLECSAGGAATASVPVEIAAGATLERDISNIRIDSARLWWPNGMGSQPLYTVRVRFSTDGYTADEDSLRIGIRRITTRWNTHTQSRELYINGRRMFVKGSNRILSDALLRFSPARYDAEVRYHRDMHLNMIRVWGGGITERPEFYEACDRYGLLVFQDLWASGDCNGRWHDTYKKDDTNTRRQYPDNHALWLAAAADQVKMLRNHPSLAIWCGGNEIRPAADILRALRDTLLPALDPTRYFFEFSNHDSMSLHAHDGPYTIQKDSYFFEHRSWAFNSEIGSVGIGDITSLKRFIPEANLVPPYYDTAARKWVADSVWKFHKYYSYDSSVEAYGHPQDVAEFARLAQLVNYNQYRALMEGFRSHMWDWYTGVLEWKTQNPWTAMVGQMYDVYLDPNACLFGMRTGAKPLHVLHDPVRKTIMVANDAHQAYKVGLAITSRPATAEGAANTISIDSIFTIPPDTCISILPFSGLPSGGFLRLAIKGYDNAPSDDNTYWLPDADGSYRWLRALQPMAAFMGTTARYNGNGHIELTVSFNEQGVAFFNHITLVDKKTRKRILPVFCSDNYFTLLQGSKTINIDFTPAQGIDPMICIEGLNTGKRYVEIGR